MNIVTKFLTYQNQVKILHWQTTSYSQHMTLGSLYDSLSENIDEFIEVFSGKYGRIVAQDSFKIFLENYENMNPQSLMNEIENYLINELPSMLDKTKDSDLLNIRDEILASINKTKYLLTLR